MKDDGLGEFGGLGKWRDVELRFRDGSTTARRLIELDGRLPDQVDLPLNAARTVYERFVRRARDEASVYDWQDIIER